jgi:hypothetical protein
MHPVLARILKKGLVAAIVLGLVGVLIAEAAGAFFAAQSADAQFRVTVVSAADPAAEGEDLVPVLRRRLPLVLAAWGFGTVVALELVLALCGGRRPTASTRHPGLAAPSDEEVEKLLNQLLQQADAAQAARAQPADTPPPAGPCPDPQPADNTPVNN